MSLIRFTNKVYGSIFLVLCVLVVVFDHTDESGLAATLTAFVAFCTIIAWGIQLHIDRRASRQPSRQLTPNEMKRYKVTRIIVAVGLIAMIAFAVLT